MAVCIIASAPGREDEKAEGGKLKAEISASEEEGGEKAEHPRDSAS
jgi:hypothetical protein